jgi:hypothetical protein
MVKLIIRKSDALKIDLNTEDNFGKTGISYFEMQVQEELNAYGLKNNAVVLPDFSTMETRVAKSFKKEILPSRYSSKKVLPVHTTANQP